ncbi:glycosyltransferase [Nocardioides conyzicola]|uniref:4,4'-diaponeurosporenoate glycosyltransferase n=1 Tax=Nocardioides conyzicola TaxID=1651781 RepID=A0ABP8X9I6_9ACTN
MIVDVVHVVVPAHDEEELLGACLASVATAATALVTDLPGVVVRTTVVLDGCTDGTAAVAATYGVDTVAVDATSVGVARATGVERVAAQAEGHPPERVLVVSTDADCVVPERWLVDLWALASAGFDLVVGAVDPDPADLPSGVLDRWRDRHRRPEAHVHGANLAFTLAAYARSGGLRPVRLHEDVLLVAAMRDAGCRWTTATSVRTSGRTMGRVPGGFATYLAGMVAQAE